MAGTDRRWLVLAVVLVGTFMAVLDVAIVNVAIPSIREDLHAGFGAVELVIAGYTLTYASLLVTGGRLGDLYGRKQLFIVGMLVFGAASALCGAAPNIGVLVTARALQGIGSALMYPQVLAIIQVTFAGQERARALGLFGSVAGLAAISGQIVGGSLLALNILGLGWRPVFLVNVPLALLAVAAAARWLPADRRAEHTRLDLGGVGLATALLLLFAVPLLLGRDAGWPGWAIGSLVAVAPVALVFHRYERRVERRGGHPLVPLRLFANRGFAAGIPIALCFVASYAGFLFILAVYLQTGLGFSPLRSGLTYTPAAVGFFITSLAAPRLVPLLGRRVLSTGYVIAALGLLATATTAAAAGTGLHGWELAPTLFIAGLGQGLGMSPLVGTIIASLHPEEAGAGSGVVTTSMQAANVLGVAGFGLVFFSLVGSAGPGEAYAAGFGRVLPISAGLLLVAALLVHWLPRAPGEADNPLIERLPGWATGFAYSMFLATGGRVGDTLFRELLSHVAEQRLRRVQEAPDDPGDFLAYHFHATAAEGAWLAYLIREGLTHRNGPIPHEKERLPVIQAQVEEIRRRQAAGLIAADLDPALVRLAGFALSSYPRVLPQITRMTTGLTPDDPRFTAEWEDLLRRIGRLLGSVPTTDGVRGRSSARR
ncbi:MAG: MFS transporter [Streptosporangiales bacterium]|nr:MFS transporter [Streptosporangiales bacterium]